MPVGHDELLADLRPSTRVQYRAVSAQFFQWARDRHLPTNTRTEVDMAAFAFLGTVSKQRCTLLVASLIKQFPTLKFHLPWTFARCHTLGAAEPPRHHPPLPWHVAVGMAYALCRMCQPRRGLLLLMQWRFGLRPSEAIELTREAVYLRPWLGAGYGLSFLRLGLRRGTKLRRPQVARARLDDPTAAWLLSLAVQFSPAGARLADIYSYPTYAAAFKKGLTYWGLPLHWTPHSARAGWASWRWSCGHAFSEIVEDGRWSSPQSLRTYLDCVAAAEAPASGPLWALADQFHRLAESLGDWLPAALHASPYRR